MNMQNNNMYQPRSLSVILVSDMNEAGTYFPINPGTSQFFLNEAMTELRMKGKDPNGFPLPDRVFEIKEVTPQPMNQSNFATKEDVQELKEQMAKLLAMLK